jgi:integration host factor subunit alpha
MTGKTITRADLTEAVYDTVSLSRAEAADLVEQVIWEMSAALASGESVKLSGFGVFTVRHKNERVGRNPRTGVTVPIEPRRSLTFSASPHLRTRVNGGTPEPRSRRISKEPLLARSATDVALPVGMRVTNHT